MAEQKTAETGWMDQAREFVKDVRVEAQRVSWPTRQELRDSTLVVIVMVFVISVFIGIVDRGLSLAFEALIKMAG